MNLHIRPVDSYQSPSLKPAIEAMLADIPGPFEGKKVLLKANLLRKASPSQAITTHPNVVEHVARFFVERGAFVTIADSPGGPSSLAQLREIYRLTGMEEAAKRSGAHLNEDLRSELVSLPEAATLREFPVLRVVLEADLLINLAKLKTHAMMTYTGALKNLFGVIPGLTKASHHMKLQEPRLFAEHLVDLEQYIRADYHLIDGIEAMEGNGPGGGDPRVCGVLLGCQNAHTLDRAACEIAGIPFEKVPTLLSATKRALFEEVNILGDLVPVSRPFTLPDSLSVTFLPFWLPSSLQRFLLDKMRPLPLFNHARCIGCGKCAAICPAHVITMRDNKAHHTKKGCISCFCCAEICPVKAIDTARPLLSRIFESKTT